jgi:DNA-binding NarL/FixJ family response regulator
MSHVLFVSPDIMFASQLLGAAGALGLKLAIAAQPAEVAARVSNDCRLAIVDLAAAGGDIGPLVSAVRQAAPQTKVVAYGPHVDEALLLAAQRSGCDLVLSRGQFHKQYVELLKQAVAA